MTKDTALLQESPLKELVEQFRKDLTPLQQSVLDEILYVYEWQVFLYKNSAEILQSANDE